MRYFLFGNIREIGTHRLLPGLRVMAFDADRGVDDLLGEDWTNAGGSFAIWFTEDQFIDEKMEQGPDIYLRVFGPEGNELYNSTESIRLNAEQKEAFWIEIPKGKVPTVPEKHRRFVVSGIIKRTDGTTVSGVEVRAAGRGLGLGSTYSDSKGRFSLGIELPKDSLPETSGQFQVRVKVFDYAGQILIRKTGVRLRHGAEPSYVEINLNDKASSKVPSVDEGAVASLMNVDGMTSTAARAIVLLKGPSSKKEFVNTTPEVITAILKAAVSEGYYADNIPSVMRILGWINTAALDPTSSEPASPPSPAELRDLNRRLGNRRRGGYPGECCEDDLDYTDPKYQNVINESLLRLLSVFNRAGIDFTRLGEFGLYRVTRSNELKPGLYFPSNGDLREKYLEIADAINGRVQPYASSVWIRPNAGSPFENIAAIVCTDINMDGQNLLFSDEVDEAYIIAERLLNPGGGVISWIRAGRQAESGSRFAERRVSGRERYRRSVGPSSVHARGANGWAGWDGQPGRPGTSGKDSPNVNLIVRELSTLPSFDLRGEDGGAGGRGQGGENGSDGQRGGPAESCYVHCCAGVGYGGDGGNGGNSGMGGTGGNGGEGGNLEIFTLSSFATNINIDEIEIDQSGGQAGTGGDAGQGGNAGRGGMPGSDDGELWCSAEPQREGDSGQRGRGLGGPQGLRGQSGSRPAVRTISEDQWEQLFTRPYIVFMEPNPALPEEDITLFGTGIPVNSQVLVNGNPLAGGLVETVGDDILKFPAPPSRTGVVIIQIVSPNGERSNQVVLRIRPWVDIENLQTTGIPSSEWFDDLPSYRSSDRNFDGRTRITIRGRGFQSNGVELHFDDQFVLEAEDGATDEEATFILPTFEGFEDMGINEDQTFNCKIVNIAQGTESDSFEFNLKWNIQVPVVAHRVQGSGDPDVITHWSEDDIRDLFESGDGVNSIWERHGIRFNLENVRITSFPTSVADHWPRDENVEGYNEMIARKNEVITDPNNTYKINVFFVEDIEEEGIDTADGVTSYEGWIVMEDREIGLRSGGIRVMAHELGHFFQLPHRNDEDALMFAGTLQFWLPGRQLNEDEVRRARSVARRYHRDE